MALLFSDHRGKPQFDNDLQTVNRLRVVLPDQLTATDITDLAMLMIRYQYPTDLEQIAKKWGFSLNSLLAAARNHWERGEYVTKDTEVTGSAWDFSQND